MKLLKKTKSSFDFVILEFLHGEFIALIKVPQKSVTLTRLDVLRIVFSGQFDRPLPPFIFQEELI